MLVADIRGFTTLSEQLEPCALLRLLNRYLLCMSADIEQRGGVCKSRRFSLVFRTLTVPQMTNRLERAGFRIHAVLGDYSGEPWDPRANVWLILAEKQP